MLCLTKQKVIFCENYLVVTKDWGRFQSSQYFPPKKRFQRYPKFADRKILTFTSFFNFFLSSAQSSEYLLQKNVKEQEKNWKHKKEKKNR